MFNITDVFISKYSNKITAEQELEEFLKQLRDPTIQTRVIGEIKQKQQNSHDDTDKQVYDNMITYINNKLGRDTIGGRGKKYRRSKKKRSHKISKRRRKKSMRKKKTRRR